MLLTLYGCRDLSSVCLNCGCPDFQHVCSTVNKVTVELFNNDVSADFHICVMFRKIFSYIRLLPTFVLSVHPVFSCPKGPAIVFCSVLAPFNRLHIANTAPGASNRSSYTLNTAGQRPIEVLIFSLRINWHADLSPF